MLVHRPCSPVVDAEVSLRQIPLEPGDGRALGHDFRSTDPNIFASVFDVVRPQVRGTAAGLMNMMGWLGGGAAPVVIGYVAQHRGASLAISLASVVYVVAGILLVAALAAFVRTDVARVQRFVKV